jgi:hypothetical protein
LILGPYWKTTLGKLTKLNGPGLLHFIFIALSKDMKAYISIEDDPHGRLLQRNLNLIFSALTGWM